MAIDLAKLDAQIRDLQDLRRLASNPDMAQLLEGLIIKNGNGVRPRPAEISDNTSDQSSLTEVVRKVSASFGRAFTIRDVREKMDAMGFSFTAQNPEIAVGSVLRRMREKGQLQLAEESAGRKPAKFQYPASASAE